MLALLHPMMPFVTEEIWASTRRSEGHLAVHAFPAADESLFDEAAEEEVEGGIGLTQRLRAWRDLAGVPAGATLPAVIDGVEPPDFVARLSRFEFDGVGAEPVASIGPVRVLASDQLDAEAVAERLEKRREELRAEVERGERKLGNEGFVAKAPAEVVEEERGQARALPHELAELESVTWSRGPAPVDWSDRAYLDSLEPVGWRLGLERMRKLTTALGLPQHRFASVHVVGTNGKSSVTRMTAALLEAHGLRAGACVSPHTDRWSRADADRTARRSAPEAWAERGRAGRGGGRGRRPQPRGGRGGDPVRGGDRGRLRRPRRRRGSRWRWSRPGSAAGSTRPT